MDTELLIEILSAITGTTVRHHTEPRTKNSIELTVHNFISPALCSALRYPQCKDLPGLIFNLTPTDEVDNARGEPPEMFLILDDLYDPQYDYDFRNLTDSSKCTRGEESYTRPQGWYRYALKVLHKYPDGDKWLGPDGWRSQSAIGEWPVSFHGTSLKGAKGIVEQHFKPGPGMVYGRGIYSTPKLLEAEYYAKRNPLKSKNGKTYIIILQNRINPAYRTICDNKDYWCILIPEKATPQEEKRIATEAIRPYGILVKEV